MLDHARLSLLKESLQSTFECGQDELARTRAQEVTRSLVVLPVSPLAGCRAVGDGLAAGAVLQILGRRARSAHCPTGHGRCCASLKAVGMLALGGHCRLLKHHRSVPVGSGQSDTRACILSDSSSMSIDVF